MTKRITIKEVAKHAGVSVATVSNVLNNINKASEETKEKVLNAVSELKYQPDYTARSLSMKKSNIIGVILPVINDGDLVSSMLRDNPFYAEFLSGIECNARKHGYDIMISGIENDDYRKWILKRNFDGLIFLGIYHEAIFATLGETDMPAVLVDSYENYKNNFYNIGIDDEYGGYIAAKHLIDKGHTKIAVITGDISKSPVNRKRIEGYKRSLSEAKIEFNDERVITTDVSFDGGYNIGKKIGETDVTAVFAVADIMALGIVKGIIESGKKVPDDISVIGFDDLSIAKYGIIGLTTVKQDIFSKGIKAVEVIIDFIENDKKYEKAIVMPIEIVERETVKNLN